MTTGLDDQGGAAVPQFDPDTLREKYRSERDKRLREDGIDQYLYVAGNTSKTQGVSVEWSCGLKGIDDKYMPARCLED